MNKGGKMEWHDEFALYHYNEQKENNPIIKKESKMESTSILFDKAKLSEFKIAFEEAKKRNDHYFMFDGNEFFIGYAKYAIEYLENEFKKSKEND